MPGRSRTCCTAGMSAVRSPEIFDVVILGGGPAGSAAALTLSKYSSLRVLLVERTDYSGFRIGECLGPGALSLLAHVEAAACLDKSAHLPAHGSCAAWGSVEIGSQDFLLSGRGHGWHLDRRRFDHDLAMLAQARGCGLMLNARLTSESRDDDGAWLLSIRQGRRKQISVRGRFVIDATGRRADFARRRGSKLRTSDRLVGVVGLCETSEQFTSDSFTLVETMPVGWWYSALLPDRRMLAVLMCDADLVRSQSLHQLGPWNEVLGASLHTWRRVSGCRLSAPLRVYAACSQSLDPCAGDGWIAAGEAAASFDPLSSGGIGHALLSGIEAARSAHASLEGDSRLVKAYCSSVARHCEEWSDLRRGYYAIEQRWAGEPFWSRRSAVKA